ncbi:MAG: hypothetical protein AAGJ84_15825 [Pseudomonadota bacterium]
MTNWVSYIDLMRSFVRLFPLALILVAPASADPLSDALAATEAPVSLRVAFDVELTSAAARQVFRFDPRWPEGRQWKLLEDEGEDAFLDEVAATWGAEVAPDGRLFPDDLRESIGDGLEIDTIGPAQRLRFRHSPSANDGEFDIWAAERLSATAWLSPEAGRFLRIDYALPRPVRGPEGGRLIRFDQSYFLENDPEFGVSLITAISVDFEARGGFRRIAKNYRARILKAEVFFATREEETRFLSSRNALASES